jgi:hypothetical protein
MRYTRPVSVAAASALVVSVYVWPYVLVALPAVAAAFFLGCAWGAAGNDR